MTTLLAKSQPTRIHSRYSNLIVVKLIMASKRTSNAYQKVIQHYNGKYGPLPALATQYLLLKIDVDSTVEKNRKNAKMEQLISGEYQAPEKSKHLTQSKSQLAMMETQLLTQNHIYRSDYHKMAVLQLIFPNDVQYELPEEKPVVVAPKPVMAPIVQQPERVYNDAWY